MAIVGCLSIFECAATIGKTLESIRDFVDRIIFIDGAYEGFSNHIFSADGTLAQLRGFPKVHAEIRNGTGKPWKSQVRKRSHYLLPSYYDRGDWVFIIDGDEYIKSGASETREFLAKSSVSYHSVSFCGPDGTKQGERIRLIRYMPGLQYVGNHMVIKLPNGDYIRSNNHAPLAPLTIIHDQSKRTPEYKEAMRRYQTLKLRIEQGIPRGPHG